MPYMIETFDKPEHQALRLAVRDVHLAYLDAHKERLLACGAKLSDDGATASGGLYLLDCETREAAKAFIDADPFSQAGLFERVVICRWRKAYLDGIGYL
ncbi:YciI family protein [Halomonas aquamarina]|uniref:YciI family protein n=1 Tax=Vreelandella aquamarina TaxID=77097 RepID=A0ACC5VTG4_9GAMM|nr:YciI family protein [Halomonas aquamarina]MBZ5487535.1 YciI family protein [Halomonas aquamarina]